MQQRTFTEMIVPIFCLCLFFFFFFFSCFFFFSFIGQRRNSDWWKLCLHLHWHPLKANYTFVKCKPTESKTRKKREDEKRKEEQKQQDQEKRKKKLVNISLVLWSVWSLWFAQNHFLFFNIIASFFGNIITKNGLPRFETKETYRIAAIHSNNFIFNENEWCQTWSGKDFYWFWSIPK